MKKGILGILLAASVSLVSCQSATDKINEEGAQEAVVEGVPTFSFDETNWDFGSIEEGKVAEHIFKFKNDGDAPLVIYNAQGSCGCTVPQWPKQPIEPGETGEIKVSFNSQGKPGMNQKNVTITANTVPNKKVLKISANVTKKQNQEDKQG